MNIWWDVIDDNSFPLNPVWKYQKDDHSKIPNAGELCGNFDEKGGQLHLPSTCTDARLVAVDEPTDRSPLHKSVCRTFNHGDDTSVYGHVNWTQATFTGRLYFVDLQNALWEDGDVDMALVPESQEGLTTDNKVIDAAQKRGIVVEYHWWETLGRFNMTGWWNQFRDATTKPDNDWEDARSLIDGSEAIIIGLFGIDNNHKPHSELHPVQGFAIKTADAPRQKWAVFARNWGNEGGCGEKNHLLPERGRKLSFLLPKPPEAKQFELDKANTAFRSDIQENVRWGVKAFPEGLILTIALPGGKDKHIVYGEVAIRTDAKGAPKKKIAVKRRRHEEKEKYWDEGSLLPLKSRMTPAQWETLLQELQRQRTEEAKTLESYSAPQDDSIAEQHRRKLEPNEERKFTREISEYDEQLAAKRKAVFNSLQGALGSQEEVEKFLKEFSQSR